MKAIGCIGAILALGVVLAGCSHWHGDDENDILVESETLVSVSGGCVVRGTVRNNGNHTLRVFISWEAFDRDDDKIGRAEVEIRDFPRDTSRDYESTRFRDFDGDRPRCDRIKKIERDKSAFRD